MTFRKKVTVSALVLSMLTASLGGLPLSQKGLAEKLGLVHTANAAESELPSSAFLEQMNEVYAALAAGDPADVQDVRNLRNEIAGLNETANLQLIDPIWNKISPKLPESVDQAELKASLFRLVKAVGSFRYDHGAADLEDIRTNNEFRATLKTIAAAGGNADINMDDFLVFLFGDGGSRKGVEGTVSAELENMSLIQLMSLLGNKQGITAVLLQATDKLLGETDAYKFSSILNDLDITPQDVRSTVLNFQEKLQKDEPAINAMTVAYIRSAAEASAQVSEDGLQHTYSLKVFGVEIPGLALNWSKVSGSADVNVTAAGVVTIPEGVASASAVLQAKLVNPYGGSAKVIFEKEVTLTAAVGEETEFPAEQFLERMNKLHAALAAGDPADILDVQSLRDEIAELDAAEGQQLIDPVWSKIAAKLPASADEAALKASFFEIIKAVGSIQYDPKATELEAIRTNPEYRATLKTIAAASGNPGLVMDDFLLFLFGDGDAHRGVEGTVRDLVANMSATELLVLLGNKQGITELQLQAMQGLLSNSEDYKLSAILTGLGVTPQDIGLTVLGFQTKLQKDIPAMQAMTIAYMRSESTETSIVSEDGRQHNYSLKVLGIDVPALALTWVKASGSADVTVLPNGTVTIPQGVASASAVIQAKLVNPYGGAAKVIFEKEVTLTSLVEEGNVFPAEQFLERMKQLHAALAAGDSSDVKDVRKLRDEIAGLNPAKDQAIIDSIWKPIAAKLPATADQAALKKSLFEIFKAVGSIQYDPDASQLEAIRTNADFRATLETIAEAGGSSNLTIDDFLILMFGDGGENRGVEGTVLDLVAAMDSKEFAELLSNKDGLTAVKVEALAAVISNTEDYALSEILNNLGVTPVDLAATVVKLQSKLKHEEAAIQAMTTAYIRSGAAATVKVTENGRQHDYGLTVLGVELPASSLKWKKVSGSKDVKVESNGKVTLSEKVLEGTVVIQATLSNYYGSRSKVIFEQEITLVNEDVVMDPKAELEQIVQALEDQYTEIKGRLDAATDDSQKVALLAEVVKAGKDSIEEINKVEAEKAIKIKAINNTKKQVRKMISLILRDLISF